MKNVFCCHHLTINIISFIAKNCNLHLAKEAYLIINKHVDYAKNWIYNTHLSTAVAWREKKIKHFCLLQIFLSGIDFLSIASQLKYVYLVNLGPK